MDLGHVSHDLEDAELDARVGKSLLMVEYSEMVGKIKLDRVPIPLHSNLKIYKKKNKSLLLISNFNSKVICHVSAMV